MYARPTDTSEDGLICPTCQASNEAAVVNCARCGGRLDALAGGAMIAGRYQIVAPLGRGGMGVVYRALDCELEETVAVKVLRFELAMSAEIGRRFRSEIKLARKVSHRNVCRIHEYGRDGGLTFIVMEYVEGVDLKRVLKERGALAPQEAFDIALQMTQGLGAIHEAGIVHRDLKTTNIMRDVRGVVKLMDFGIAKSYEGETATLGGTAAGLIVGTPEYMSPEQARGEKLDVRSDIYSLGVVLFELFTGDVPFHGDTPIATLFKHVQDPLPLDSPAGRRIPAPAAPVVVRATSKAREDRFASADEVEEALRTARAELFPQGAETARWLPTAVGTGALPRPALDPAALPTPVPTRSPTRVPTAVPTMVPPSRRRSPAVGGRRDPSVAALLVVAGFGLIGLGGLTALGIYVLRTSLSPPETPRTALAATPLPSPPPQAAPAPSPAISVAPPVESVPAPVQSAPSLVESAPSPPLPRRPGPGQSRTPADDGTSRRTGDRSRQEAPALAEAKGFLQLLVLPWAEVSVDGMGVGTTPLKPVALAPGVHVVQLAHPEYQPLQKKVTVRPGDTTRLEVDLSFEAFPK